MNGFACAGLYIVSVQWLWLAPLADRKCHFALGFSKESKTLKRPGAQEREGEGCVDESYTRLR
uniref:Uncharacterized protein n=1 Tax=Anguilla anguilla TaxID=7936 RepID=A0A0E9PMP7_ANGAN